MWEWGVRALGLFWFVGGVMTLRALRQARPLDALMAALQGGARPRDRVRAALLTFGAVLTTASGVALAALDRVAPGLMIANAVVQAIWLVYAASAFPPEDEEDLVGRRRVRNAFVLWTVATVAVVAAAVSGSLVLGVQPLTEAVISIGAVAVSAFEARAVFGRGADDGAEAATTDDDPTVLYAPFDPSVRRRLMIAPNIYTPPLRDVDTDETFHPEALDLAADLVVRIDDLEHDVREALAPSRDDPEVFVLTPEAHAGFAARIAVLVEELRPHALDGEVEWWLPPVEDAAASAG